MHSFAIGLRLRRLPALTLTLAALGLVAGRAPAQNGGFPIADSLNSEVSIGAAFDGQNFLVAVQGDASHHSNVGAQLVSPAGTLIGPLISTGRTGGAPLVAFGALDYLLVWTDDMAANDHIYGQLIGPAGTQGPLLVISQVDLPEDIAGVAWNGSNYLVVYHRDVDSVTGLSRVYGRLVSPGGSVGPEIQISAGFGNYSMGHGSTAASDGADYLVTWTDGQNDYEVRARVVHANGGLGAEFSVNASLDPSDNPLSIGFGGTDYLVIWPDELGGPGTDEWDLLGQRVSPGGTLVGGVIPVATSPGAQHFATLAFDGSKYFATWTDTSNDTDMDGCDPGEGSCWDIHGRFIDPAGVPIGAEWPIVVSDGDQFASPVVFGAGKYLLVWTDGNLVPDEGGDVYGNFLPTAGFPEPYCTAKVNSQGCLPAIWFSGIPSATDPSPFDVGCDWVVSNQFGILFYGFSPHNLPFQGGTLCVHPPITRTPVQNSGGNPPPTDCSGVFSYDFNARIQSGVDPSLVAGQVVYGQYWYRDPQSSPFGTGLSDALQFDIQP